VEEHTKRGLHTDGLLLSEKCILLKMNTRSSLKTSSFHLVITTLVSELTDSLQSSNRQ